MRLPGTSDTSGTSGPAEAGPVEVGPVEVGPVGAGPVDGRDPMDGLDAMDPQAVRELAEDMLAVARAMFRFAVAGGAPVPEPGTAAEAAFTGALAGFPSGGHDAAAPTTAAVPVPPVSAAVPVPPVTPATPVTQPVAVPMPPADAVPLTQVEAVPVPSVDAVPVPVDVPTDLPVSEHDPAAPADTSADGWAAPAAIPVPDLALSEHAPTEQHTEPHHAEIPHPPTMAMLEEIGFLDD